eukprot:2762311-Alexandrium_andersonii.AAC.1
MWRGVGIAENGMHLKWEVHAVFETLHTLKSLANFIQFLPVPRYSAARPELGACNAFASQDRLGQG